MHIPLPILLFIDDDEQHVKAFQKALSRLGYSVLTACNGQDALDTHGDRFSRGEIEVVVSDVSMKLMDGPTFARELRTRYPQTACPIVFLTGSAGDPRLQGERVFVKPVSPQKLSREILGLIKPVPTIPPPPGSPQGDSEGLVLGRHACDGFFV